MYAQNMPSAPWAKLNTPEVEYVTTRPLAAIANTAPVINPLISRFIGFLGGPRPRTRGLGDASARRERTEFGGDAVGVQLRGLERSRGDAGDEVLVVAVEQLAGCRHDLDPIGAVELEQHPALRSLVRAGVGGDVQAPARPARLLRRRVEHAL